MTTDEPRSMSAVVAANLRRSRVVRGMSVRALSERVGALGMDYPTSSLAKTEAEESSKRGRVDVDQLAALAVALDTSPAFLLAPEDREDVAVTPAAVSPGSEVAAWVRGDDDLQVDGDNPDEREQRRQRFLQAAPDAIQRQARIGAHPLVVAISGLEAFVRDALDPAGRPYGTPPAAGLAKGLRQEAKRVQQYAELLSDELEREAARGRS